MADEKELNDLRARIGRLGSGEQVRLLELVLADNRRRHEELVAQSLAAEAVLRETEKRELAAAEAWYSAQNRSRGPAEETKREAGEIYLVDLDPVVGLEAGGKQLVVVISTDSINASFLPVTVALVRDAVGTSSPRVYSVFVPATESGLTADVIVDRLQVRSLDQSRFPASPAGVRSPARVKDVEKALHAVFRV